MANDVKYVHHRLAEFNAFQSPTGMTGNWLRGRAENVAAHARLLAPKPGASSYATGETVASISVEGPTIGRTGPEARVVSRTDHAAMLHQGTPPHIIRPRFKKMLVFFSRKAGRVLTVSKVHHPGTKANPFLLRALRAVFGV